MKFVAGQSWGMPFIVSPNYVPQDPEYVQHYKPHNQGCAECNGVRVPPRQSFFEREVLTCEGIKVIQTTRPPGIPPVENREMDKQYLGIIPTLKYTRVINRSTRDYTDMKMISVNPQDVE